MLSDLISLILILAAMAVGGYFLKRNAPVPKQLAAFIPDLAAGGGSAASIAVFRERIEAVFTRYNVRPKKKRVVTNYARLAAKSRLTPEQNRLVIDMLKQHRIFPA